MLARGLGFTLKSSMTKNAFAFSTSDQFVYEKSVDVQVAPFSPDMTVTIDAIEDSNGVLAPAVPVTPLAPLEVRYGRWVAENVYGPENVSELYMPFRAEFWNGARIRFSGEWPWGGFDTPAKWYAGNRRSGLGRPSLV